MTNDKQRDRLVELLRKAESVTNEYIVAKNKSGHIPTAKEVHCVKADYLLENGVIVPPCKVGEEIYYISFDKVYRSECIGLVIKENQIHIQLYDFDGDKATYHKVFLTKEEAEEALTERSK